MKLFVVLFVAAVLEATSAQVIRSISPVISSCGTCGIPSCGCPTVIQTSPVITAGCGCSSPCGCSPIIQSGPIIAPACGSPVIGSCGCPTVIQSSSVANTLADTLSLLTVSSLLADTLPLGPQVVAVPANPCGFGLGGFNYGCGCGPFDYGYPGPYGCGPYVY